jgi:signal transduction histidine kinase
MLEGSGPQIVSDRVGDLWVSSSLGLCRLRERQFKCFQPVDGLPAVDPRALFVDSRGWLWIGLRYNGVSVTRDPREEQPQFVNYSNEQGMVSNTVWSVAEDSLGRMYFGTERGLEQFDVEKNLWRHFNSKNGLSGDRVHSLAKDRRGNMWICTSSGLTKFNSSAERVNDKPPPIYLSRVSIAGEELPIAETGANEIPLIELQATRNNLAIEFVGLNFTGEDNLNYQYKLEGVDADWSAPTRQRVVNYARLSAGSYRFLVRAINDERITSLTPASFRFRILPPIYMRWWFLALSVVVVGTLVVAAYRYRVSRLLELERVRTRIATDLHDDIGSNLTRISLLSELAKQQSGNGKLLSSIAEIARESVSSMNDIVWAISPQHDRIVDLTRRMRQHAEEVFSLRDIKLEFGAPASDADIHLPAGTRRDVLLIFKEAVNNTARHSGCTKVVIDFRCEHHELRLQISDNGSGFDMGSESEGHGLRSMARRASALGGELIVDSHLSEGTTVRFELPVK